MANIEEKVENLVKPKIESIGYELYDVEYVKEGKNNFLRIYIDNEKGITLNDCEKVNNEITDMLDEADYIKDQYFLEVSSPGVERIVRKDSQLKKCIGKEIHVKLFQKDEKGNKEYQEKLQGYSQKILILEDVLVPRINVAQIKTVYHWEQ